MRLGRREKSVKDLNNETVSKTVIVFHVMVTEAIFSLKYFGAVQIKMHFLQNEYDYDEGVF